MNRALEAGIDQAELRAQKAEADAARAVTSAAVAGRRQQRQQGSSKDSAGGVSRSQLGPGGWQEEEGAWDEGAEDSALGMTGECYPLLVVAARVSAALTTRHGWLNYQADMNSDISRNELVLCFCPSAPPGEEVQIEALRRKLKVSRQRQGELLGQRDMWKERCVLHEKACAGLQVGEGGEAAGGTSHR